MRTARTLAESDLNSTSRYGYSTPPTFSFSSGAISSSSQSGCSTPREIREERWAQENAAKINVNGNLTSEGKEEMREMYKEMGGRKARGKNKVGMGGNGGRDKGGWEGYED